MHLSLTLYQGHDHNMNELYTSLRLLKLWDTTVRYYTIIIMLFEILIRKTSNYVHMKLSHYFLISIFHRVAIFLYLILLPLKWAWTSLFTIWESKNLQHCCVPLLSFPCSESIAYITNTDTALESSFFY